MLSTSNPRPTGLGIGSRSLVDPLQEYLVWSQSIATPSGLFVIITTMNIKKTTTTLVNASKYRGNASSSISDFNSSENCADLRP